MNQTLKLIVVLLIVISYLLIVTAPVLAAGLLPTPTGSCPEGESCSAGACSSSPVECNYSLCDVTQVFVNVAKWILGMVGGLALLMFIWGGFSMMMSGGSPEKVQSGRKVLTAAAFGLIIVLAAWTLISIIIGMTVPQEEGVKFFDKDWSRICTQGHRGGSGAGTAGGGLYVPPATTR